MSVSNLVYTGQSSPTEYEHPASCVTSRRGTVRGSTHCEVLINPVSIAADSTMEGNVDQGDEALIGATLRFGIAHLERVRSIASR